MAQKTSALREAAGKRATRCPKVYSKKTKEKTPALRIPRVNGAAFSALEPGEQTRCGAHQKIGSEAHQINSVLAVMETTEAAQTRDLGALHKLFETDNT